MLLPREHDVEVAHVDGVLHLRLGLTSYEHWLIFLDIQLKVESFTSASQEKAHGEVQTVPDAVVGKIKDLYFSPEQPASADYDKDDAGKDDDAQGHEDDGWYDYDEKSD